MVEFTCEIDCVIAKVTKKSVLDNIESIIKDDPLLKINKTSKLYYYFEHKKTDYLSYRNIFDMIFKKVLKEQPIKPNKN
jgi:hypothetical protein